MRLRAAAVEWLEKHQDLLDAWDGSREIRDRIAAEMKAAGVLRGGATANHFLRIDLYVEAAKLGNQVLRCGDCDEDLSIGHRDFCIQEHQPLTCCDGNDPACPTHGIAASNARQNEFYRKHGK